ncbi:MAG: metallophosphoesterase [Candidatus Aenigmarchaeota archaeon]|nr:metallophosphoesterase [Candidatus Aenigmarchaeota archaeon]
MKLKFVAGEPALMLGSTLVISDLHIGIEHEYFEAGIRIPSQTEKLVKRLDNILEAAKAKRMLILGDVKHKITGTSWQEERDLPAFFSHFSKKVKTEIVLGNHDPLIERILPKNVVIHPTSGMLIGDYYLCHGHAWPGGGFEKAKCVLAGHNQPMIELKDRLGYRWVEQVWVKARLKKSSGLKARFPSMGKPPKLIILPAFNELSGGVCVNREKELMGPVAKAADMRNARIYLLDGTYLGELRHL